MRRKIGARFGIVILLAVVLTAILFIGHIMGIDMGWYIKYLLMPRSIILIN